MDKSHYRELSRSSPPSGDHETLMENRLNLQKQLRSSEHDSPDRSDASEVGQTGVKPRIEPRKGGVPFETRQRVVHPHDGSSAIPEDGFAWTKHGQLDILGEIGPRGYYGCAHKRDFRCLATKQVQRKKDTLEVYYFGAHNHGPDEGSGNLNKRLKVDGTGSSQTSSVGIPFSGDSIELSSKSSIENPFTPDEMEFDLSPAASVQDVLPDNEFLADLDQDWVDPHDDLKLDSLLSPFDPKSVPLPEDLKWYFSLFPLDYEFDKDSLIQLWIAEGYITNEFTKRMEDLGSVFFSRLLDEGFIVSSGYHHSCDKFKYKVNEAKIGERLMFDGNKLDDIPPSSRHLSLRYMDINHSTSMAVKKCQLLSTLFLFPHLGSCVKHIPRDFFFSLKGLCVLNLSQSGILEIPSSIGSMTSLLYLDVSETSIKWLPESIGCLSKLQTLKLRCCFNLLGLPKAVKKLINLRHLDLDVVRQLNSMPAGLGYLINIQTLSAFIIGEYDGCQIGELKNLSNLRGEFCLVRLENVVDSSEALEAALWDKRYLQKLELKWSDSCSETVNEEEKILEYLRPHDNIQELKICFYSGSKLPSWISSPSYFKLVSISFYKCRNCEFLPSIGTLPSLKFLYINEMNCVKEISRQFFKNDPGHVGCAFPKLEKLSIDVMLGLEEWKEIELGDLPCLLKLTMQCCPELVTLPSFSGLDSLKHLEVIDCPKLPSLPEGLPTSLEFLLIKDCPVLKERCSSQGGEDWQKVSHVPCIWVELEEISSQI